MPTCFWVSKFFSLVVKKKNIIVWYFVLYQSFSWLLLITFEYCQGPPGTGKTTSILALAHELLGPNYREGVLELNASDDR